LLSDKKADGMELSEQVSFRDAKRIIAIVDDVAEKRGTDRSSMYRMAMRYWLAENSHLSEEEKKALGLNGKTK
jgi:metal-responsive CopG/Arc/MetJ family transcriptional regulator